MQVSKGIFLAALLLLLCILFSGCTFSAERHTPVVNTTPALPAFTPEDITYFEEVALGYEFSNSPEVVYRWKKNPVIIRTSGNPDRESVSCLVAVITDFNALSSRTKLLLDNQKDPDITLNFLPESRFSRIESQYIPVNMGWFSTRYDNQDCRLFSGTILISTTGLSPSERCHLIREELTQSMGLARDSSRYPDSIFYHGWTATTSYSERDARVISMLYNSGISGCSDKPAVENYFSPHSLTRSGASSSG